MEPLEQAARALAAWWRGKLGAPKDNGDRSGPSGLGCLLASAYQQAATAEQAQRFEDALTALIVAEYPRNAPRLVLGVDYHPDLLLAEALVAAGLDTGLLSPLPYKTISDLRWRWVDERFTVAVGDGYRAQWVTIWPAATG